MCGDLVFTLQTLTFLTTTVEALALQAHVRISKCFVMQAIIDSPPMHILFSRLVGLLPCANVHTCWQWDAMLAWGYPSSL